MPSSTPTLTLETARNFIARRSFPETTRDLVGVELEWFTTPSESPPDVATLHRLLDPLEPLPNGSAITFEPGGQVELSSPPLERSDSACEALAADRDVVRSALAAHGIGLEARGLDHGRTNRLQTDEPRYVTMRAYFDRWGPAGGRMMCMSAAIHVNVDAGADAHGRTRWHAAHDIGPMLIAAFANSPILDGRPSGWASSRVAAWAAIDPTRTAAVGQGADPLDAWPAYALAANVMFIRSEAGYVLLDRPFTFAEWIAAGHELGYPSEDDLVYHLTTLFPPVRPHGHLEMRMIDMVPDPWWRVAVAVTAALLHHPDVGAEACRAGAGRWAQAARDGLRDPVLRESAERSFAIALEVLQTDGYSSAIVDAVGEYIDRFVARGRSPGDEQLDVLNAYESTAVVEAR